jgi:hypothetical protein
VSEAKRKEDIIDNNKKPQVVFKPTKQTSLAMVPGNPSFSSAFSLQASSIAKTYTKLRKKNGLEKDDLAKDTQKSFAEAYGEGKYETILGDFGGWLTNSPAALTVLKVMIKRLDFRSARTDLEEPKNPDDLAYKHAAFLVAAISNVLAVFLNQNRVPKPEEKEMFGLLKRSMADIWTRFEPASAEAYEFEAKSDIESNDGQDTLQYDKKGVLLRLGLVTGFLGAMK